MKDTGKDQRPEEMADHPLIEELTWLESAADGDGEERGRGGDESHESADDTVTDDELKAYRRGELPQDRVEALEKSLIRGRQVRSRLASLAGHDLPLPSPFLRARVLRAFRREAGGTARLPARWAPLLAAALILITIAGVFLRGTFGPQALPEGLRYEVMVAGVADVRSGELETLDVAQAYAETPLEIVVAPTGLAEGDVGFAIYRGEGDAWIRMAVAQSAQVEGGVATFNAPASDLVGNEPGRYDLLIVVARLDDLPPRLAVVDVDAKDEFRRYYRQGLELLP